MEEPVVMKECEGADAGQQQPVGQSPVGERGSHDFRNQVLRVDARSAEHIYYGSGIGTIHGGWQLFIFDLETGHRCSNRFVLCLERKPRLSVTPTSLASW